MLIKSSLNILPLALQTVLASEDVLIERIINVANEIERQLREQNNPDLPALSPPSNFPNGPGPEMPGLRKLSDFTSGQFALQGWEKIYEYGCYCNFNNFREVHGQPVDEYDVKCKRLHDNYLCTIDEARAAGDRECDPSQDKYESGMVDTIIATAVVLRTNNFEQQAEESMDLVYEYCEQVNPGDVCNQGACKSESRFIYEVNPDISFFFRPETFPKDEFMHTPSGDFEYETQCIPKFEGVDKKVSESVCCGPVPETTRANRLNGKECCLQTTLFNTLTECCSATGVKILGEC